MSFWGELKRRNVVRVGLAYLIASWLVLQVIDVVGPMFDIPTWVGRSIFLFLVAGFVVSVVIAWAYEITPEGVKKEKDVDRSASVTPQTGRKLDFIIIGVLSVALAFFVYERFVLHEHEPEQVIEIAELEKSIAVLPFDNRSADESDAYFVDGIHDDILTQLHKLSDLDKVISRTSVERYRDTEMLIPEIAAELGVATILEGSVQRAGDRVRITVQLIGAANDEHMWAENYDRELTTENVFDIQSEISAAIAEALQATLTAEESSDLSEFPTLSMAAYDEYLLGRHVMRSRRIPDLEAAQGHFEAAIELDPDFALAYVGLADSNNLWTIFSFQTGLYSSEAEIFYGSIERATSAANQALEINPRLGEAYAAIGYSYWLTDRAEESGSYYEQALELTPNYADLYRWHAQQLRDVGRLDEAPAIAERAVELDPNFAINHTILGMIYGQSGRYEDAIESGQRALELAPDSEFALMALTETYRGFGEYGHVIVTAGRILEINPDDLVALLSTAMSYGQLGNQDAYDDWSSILKDTGDNRWANLLVVIQAALAGDLDEAAAKSRQMLESWPGCNECIEFIALSSLQGERWGELLTLAEAHVPEMLVDRNPVVLPRAAYLAAPVYAALRATGAAEQAEALYAAAMTAFDSFPRIARDDFGVGIADVHLHFVRGDTQFALEALMEAVRAGWKDAFALRMLEDVLGDEPQFQLAREQIQAELAEQLSWLEEQERLGNVPALPQ